MHTVKLIAALLVAGSQVAAATHELDSDLFDGIASHSDASVRLHGLAALYPGRVLFQEPSFSVNEERSDAFSIETIRTDITYIRVYRLEDALESIQAHLSATSLILDLRYTQSEALAGELSLALDRAKSHNQLTARGILPDPIIKLLAVDYDAVEPVRDSAIVVLCNQKTAGPFEALLHNLQASGAIIAVGESTAGRTGYYKEVEGPAWLLDGEIRADGQTSLVGTGFVPRISVTLSPQQHYTAYHWYEAGSSLDQILNGIPDEDGNDTSPKTIDPVLERGVEIVAALQILQVN